MDFTKIMKQAQAMQKKMEQAQQELATKEFEGTSGGGMVKAKLSGKGEVLGLSIDKSVVDPNDVQMLEDLVIAALHDAKKKADAGAQDAMSSIAGALPPGMKLPF
jgi:DNA-binding YbaB/EbfC family protein